MYSVIRLFVFLLVWSPIAASAAAPTCVVKLKFSSDDKSDSGTDAFVRQVLARQGYKIIDDWLFTIWSASDYDVKIIITHTEVPNFGSPVSFMGIELSIADRSGSVLFDGNVDRANLEGTLVTFVPTCGTSEPASDADAATR